MVRVISFLVVFFSEYTELSSEVEIGGFVEEVGDKGTSFSERYIKLWMSSNDLQFCEFHLE